MNCAIGDVIEKLTEIHLGIAVLAKPDDGVEITPEVLESMTGITDCMRGVPGTHTASVIQDDDPIHPSQIVRIGWQVDCPNCRYSIFLLKGNSEGFEGTCDKCRTKVILVPGPKGGLEGSIFKSESPLPFTGIPE